MRAIAARGWVRAVAARGWKAKMRLFAMHAGGAGPCGAGTLAHPPAKAGRVRAWGKCIIANVNLLRPSPERGGDRYVAFKKRHGARVRNEC